MFGALYKYISGLQVIFVGKIFAVWALIFSLPIRARRLRTCPSVCCCNTAYFGERYFKWKSKLGKIKMHFFFTVGAPKINLQSKNGILLPKLFWPIVRNNCSSDRKKLLKFEAEGREFAKYLRSLEQFIQTVKGLNNFG